MVNLNRYNELLEYLGGIIKDIDNILNLHLFIITYKQKLIIFILITR